MGVRISRNVFLDQSHTDVQSSYTIGVVSGFNNTHQFVVHDEGCGLKAVEMLAKREFNHSFALQGQNGCRPHWKCPRFCGEVVRLVVAIVFGSAVHRCIVHWNVNRGCFVLSLCFIRRCGFIGLVVVLVGGPHWSIVLVHATGLAGQEHK